MDDSGPGTPPMRLSVTVTVRDDDVLIDFEGTGPQTESGMNSYINYTRSYCYAAVKCLTDPDGPQNDGAFRPVRIEAPLGLASSTRALRPGAAREPCSAIASSTRSSERSPPPFPAASPRPAPTSRTRRAAATIRGDAAGRSSTS